MGLRQLKKRVLVGYKEIWIPAAAKDNLVKRALAEGMSDIQYVDRILYEFFGDLKFSEKAWKKHRQD